MKSVSTFGGYDERYTGNPQGLQAQFEKWNREANNNDDDVVITGVSPGPKPVMPSLAQPSAPLLGAGAPTPNAVPQTYQSFPNPFTAQQNSSAQPTPQPIPTIQPPIQQPRLENPSMALPVPQMPPRNNQPVQAPANMPGIPIQESPWAQVQQPGQEKMQNVQQPMPVQNQPMAMPINYQAQNQMGNLPVPQQIQQQNTYGQGGVPVQSQPNASMQPQNQPMPGQYQQQPVGHPYNQPHTIQTTQQIQPPNNPYNQPPVQADPNTVYPPPSMPPVGEPVPNQKPAGLTNRDQNQKSKFDYPSYDDYSGGKKGGFRALSSKQPQNQTD